MLLPLVSGQC
jgi:hypothetical protein